MGDAERDEHPRHHHKQQIGLLGDQRQSGDRVEQDRHFKLIVEGVADLARTLRPDVLPQSDVADFQLPRFQGLQTGVAHGEQQDIGETHLHKNRQ